MAVDPETLDQLVDTVRRYTREKLVPLEARVAEDDAIPEEILRDFREMGLFGLTTPEEHGGLGLRSSEEIEVIMELTWSSAAFRSIVGINLGLGSQALLIDGTPDQQAEWLPRIATGEVIVSFCLTEPGSKSEEHTSELQSLMPSPYAVFFMKKKQKT